ncbi:hypothetical protein BJ875DRAFT_474749 [Amylocarpus encephaloides]|uniref:Uncharacterized protein n=1 Tax=Amylocarpus encephaloides TaxID=45428 RepID=A0A9P8C136_9HELO|nr:hypothetical protein BJ875DRAFT_474749 [Amylocarpus encephaloides]
MPASAPKTGAPPPPPPPPAVKKAPTPPPSPQPPVVASTGSAGAFMVELLIYNGSPFKDHWAYWVRSHANPDIGVLIHATGDVKNGFNFEVKRSHDFHATGNRPTMRIPLQWVDAKYFNEKAMLNDGKRKIDNAPVCDFEASAYKIKAPGKTLNVANDKVTSGKRITQRNCQTWIVKSADQLVEDHIFSKEVAAYLHAIEQ